MSEKMLYNTCFDIIFYMQKEEMEDIKFTDEEIRAIKLYQIDGAVYLNVLKDYNNSHNAFFVTKYFKKRDVLCWHKKLSDLESSQVIHNVINKVNTSGETIYASFADKYF